MTIKGIQNQTMKRRFLKMRKPVSKTLCKMV